VRYKCFLEQGCASTHLIFFEIRTLPRAHDTMAADENVQQAYLIMKLLGLDLGKEALFETAADAMNMLRVCFDDRFSPLSDTAIAAIMKDVPIPAYASPSARLYLQRAQDKVATDACTLFDILAAIHNDAAAEMEDAVVKFTTSHDEAASCLDSASLLVAHLLNWHSLHLHILAVSHYK
jgi:hypothetical protein